MNKPHALVVGGSGMLKPVVIELAKKYNVSVIARNVERLNQVVIEAKSIGGKVNPISNNYENLESFEKSIKDAVNKLGQIEVAVVWIHKTSPEAYYVVAKYVGNENKKGKYIHVLGSATADPSMPQTERKKRISLFKNFKYQEVILGFIIENKQSRWLKKEEISNGVLEALRKGVKQHIVGTVVPWSAKP